MARKKRKRKRRSKEGESGPIPVSMQSEDGKELSKYILQSHEAQKVRKAAKKSGMSLEDFLKSSASQLIVGEAVVRSSIGNFGMDLDVVQRLPLRDRENLVRLIEMLGGSDSEREWANHVMESTQDLPESDRFVLLDKALKIADGVQEAREELQKVTETFGSDYDGVQFALKKKREWEGKMSLLLDDLKQKEDEVRSKKLKKVSVLPAVGLESDCFINASQVRIKEFNSLSDSAVDNYLNFLRFCLDFSRLGGPDAESYTHLWSIMRSSAIFAIPTQLYLQFYLQVDRWLSQTYGSRWKLKTENAVADREVYNIDAASPFLRWVVQKAQSQSIPEKLPFDRFFVGYEPPPALNPVQLTLLHMDDKDTWGRKIEQVFLVGHLITPLRVISVLMCGAADEVTFAPLVDLSESGWVSSSSCVCTPWVVPALIDWINEHRTVFEDGKTFGYRRRMQKEGKALKVKNLVPPPYYTVYMKDTLVQEAKKYGESRFKREIEWNHRWTVRGHWMVRVKRGPLPLGIEDEQKLRQRKYKIFTLDSPDFETWKHLEKRGVKPKRVDEWMAVLISWRKDYVKGPEDKPLIPSVRKSAKKRRNHEEIN